MHLLSNGTLEIDGTAEIKTGGLSTAKVGSSLRALAWRVNPKQTLHLTHGLAHTDENRA